MKSQTPHPIDPTVASVARTYLFKQLDKADATITKLLSDETEATQIKGVHDLRVAARRLRIGLNTFRQAIPKKLRRKLSRRIHELQDAAAEVRDLDVWRIELERLQRGRRYKLAVAFAAAKAGSKRRKLGQALNKKASELQRRDVWRRAKRRLDLALTASPFEGDAAVADFASLATELLQKRLASFDAAFADTEGDEPATLHQARIAGKKLRYTIEVIQAAFDPAAAKKALKALKALQNSLGALCDALVFAELAVKLAGDEDADVQTQASLDLLAHHYQRLATQRIKDFRLAWQQQGENGPRQSLLHLTQGNGALPPAADSSGETLVDSSVLH